MTDVNLQFGPQPNEPHGDDDAREARHQVLATLLGAYADGELPPETASQIDAHLLGCARCRREVDVQRAVHDRLSREPLVPAPSALHDRIVAEIALARRATSSQASVAPAASRRGRFGVVGVAVVAMLVTGAATRSIWPARALHSSSAVAAASVPLFTDLLSDYRRATSGDLPGRARDLDAVRAAVPFPVEPLTGSGLRLLAVWSTDLAGEPAAVLAYRWNDRTVLEYVVAEPQFFRSPSVRSSIAASGAVTATGGTQSLLGWAAAESGIVLVADVGAGELATLRPGEGAH